MQIQEFGQTPKQLFNYPHPKRCASSSCTASDGIVTSNISSMEISLHSEVSVDTSTFVSRKKEVDKLVYRPDIPTEIENSSDIPASSKAPGTSKTSIAGVYVTGIEISLPYNAAASDRCEVMRAEPSEEPKEIIELGKEFQDEVERVLRAEREEIKNIDTSSMILGKVGKMPSPESDPENKMHAQATSAPPSTFGSWVGAKIGSLWNLSNTSSRLSAMQHDEPLGEKIKIDDSFGTHSQAVSAVNSTSKVQRHVSSNTVDDRNFQLLATLAENRGRPAEVISMKSSEPFHTHSEPITCVSLSADGRTMISSSKDSTMKVYFYFFLWIYSINGSSH